MILSKFLREKAFESIDSMNKDGQEKIKIGNTPFFISTEKPIDFENGAIGISVLEKNGKKYYIFS